MLDTQITHPGPNWHPPTCVILYEYYLDYYALNSTPFFRIIFWIQNEIPNF